MSDPTQWWSAIGSGLGGLSVAWNAYQLARKKKEGTSENLTARVASVEHKTATLEDSMKAEKTRISGLFDGIRNEMAGMSDSIRREMGWDRTLQANRHTENVSNFEGIREDHKEMRNDQKEIATNVTDILKILGQKVDRYENQPGAPRR